MTLTDFHNIYNKNIMVIYVTENIINGRKYIGKNVSNSPSYLGSGVELKKDIDKYGKENFTKTILEICNSKQHLAEREEYWLNYFDVESNPLFYNKTNKAFGHSGHSEKTKKIISMSKQGKKLSIEHRKKQSEGRKGHKMYTKEWAEKIGKANKGKPKPKGFGEKVSKIHKNNTNRRKKVKQYDINGNFIKEWDSVLLAAQSLGKKQGAAITEVCNNKRKTAYGFIWGY